MSLFLKELQLKNFKCFKKEQHISFKKLTILTGANSSGKSSFLHGILGAIQSGEFPYKFSPNGKYVNMGDFKEISHNHTAKEITLGMTFHSSSTQRDYKFKTTWKNGTKNYLPELKSVDFSSNYFSVNIRNTKGWLLDFSYSPQNDPEYTPEKAKSSMDDMIRSFMERRDRSSREDKNNSFGKELNKFKKYVSTIYKKIAIKNYKIGDIENMRLGLRKKGNMRLDFTIDGIMNSMCNDFDDNINAISSFRLHPDRTYLEQSKDKLKIDKFGEGYLDQIILWEKRNSPKFKELKAIMKRLALIQSISAHRIEGGRFEVMVTTKKNGTKTSIFDVGFGISQFLPIIVADLQLDNDSTLFVAEPEIHLHPNVQAKFADYLVGQLDDDKKKKNYVIETHSEYLLNRIRLAIVKGTLKESNLAVYYLENSENDIKIHKLNFGKRGQIEGAPESFFDTYLMDIRDIALNV